MRIPFLVLPPVCVFVGAATVVADGVAVDFALLTLVLIGAVSAHVSVNTLNEYRDFSSGLDLETVRTPFSGGSGALPQHPEVARSVLLLSLFSLLITFLIGLYFLMRWGWPIVPIGLSGMVLIATYTDWINKKPILCLFAPGFGFGFLMVLGTQFALMGYFTLQALLVSFIVFFLVNNLLLLNQYPDINADRNAGRNHLPIAYGVDIASRVYISFVISVIILIIVAVYIDLFPTVSLVALLGMPLALYSYRGARLYGTSIGEHPPFLAANVVVTVLTPLLLGLSLVIN